MRYLLLASLLLLAACNQTPEAEPDGHRALHPPQGQLGYSDAEVEAFRGKLKTITFPQPPGGTMRSLGLEPVNYSGLAIDDYKPNSKMLLASHRKSYKLNSRQELVVVEDHFASANNNVAIVERTAIIQPIVR